MIAKGYADSEAQQQHIFTDLRELREERHPETIEQSTQCSQNDTTGISLDFDTGTNKIKQVIIYPEMISPELTIQLIKTIAVRSHSRDDFMSIFSLATTHQ